MERISKTKKIIKPLKVKVIIDNEYLNISIGRKNYSFLLDSISQKLKSATAKKRQNFSVSPSGYGIHWPFLDEDISISTLLKSKDY
jgi:hypothetical protein